MVVVVVVVVGSSRKSLSMIERLGFPKITVGRGGLRQECNGIRIPVGLLAPITSPQTTGATTTHLTNKQTVNPRS